MESYISEIENPIVQKDVIELGNKIAQFKEGTINEDKFKALRLARGVYGQRQQGVQMIRIKLPFGKLTPLKLRRIADVSDEYSTGNLHITTRQDIQIHYVSLDRTPQLWAELEKDEITLREACGNTVRNVTASPTTGIEVNEPFDVSPYADLVFRYFLRKSFGQELGRKIKIAFSASDQDDAFTFIHDFGFIPKIQVVQGEEIKGFKVLIGGGLGAQPFLAHVAFDFLPENELIPFVEASIRVFDRHGERNSRNKARLKYLLNKIGPDAFLELVKEEQRAVEYKHESDFKLVVQNQIFTDFPGIPTSKKELLFNTPAGEFRTWLETNVIEQKQKGYFAAYVKVPIGDFSTDQARKIASLLESYTQGDARLTIDQSLLLKFILPQDLEKIYKELVAIGLETFGYNSLADVTACPGTDTCNLGISNSTQVAKEIENFIYTEYPDLIYNQDIKVKISGCMNSCGQHGLAHIGFHGSSMKVNGMTAPALQILLGGGGVGDGFGRVAEKVIKIPSKRVLDVMRYLIDDYLVEQLSEEKFHAYYDRKGNRYFYDLLKPLASTEAMAETDFIDWGEQEAFKTAIGIGECAGVQIDLVGSLLYDAKEKIEVAQFSIQDKRFSDAIYQVYAAGIHIAKALLLELKVHCNTQHGVIEDFTSKYDQFTFEGKQNFRDFILQIRSNEPSEDFAQNYYNQLLDFEKQVVKYRSQELVSSN
jgi:sulfite reductase (ferredoxin)